MRSLTAALLAFWFLAGCDGAAIVSRPRATPDGATDASAVDDAATVPILDAPMADPSARGWVSGRAWDARNGEPLSDVEFVIGDAVVGRTDPQGAYSLMLPQGAAVLTARASGRLPFVRRIVVGESPQVLDLPLTALGPTEMVTPAGATITTRQGVTLRFPPGAVRAPTMVTATWLDGDAVGALDAPAMVGDGETDAVLRGALVVTDLTAAAPVRVEIPVPSDALPSSLSLRPLRDGGAGPRLWPVSAERGTAVFEVPHFSAWGLWVELPEVLAAEASCGGQRLGRVVPSSNRWDLQVERGAQRIPLSASSTDPERSRFSAPPVDIFCGDTIRAPRRAEFLMSGDVGGLRVVGENFPFRLFGNRLDLRLQALPIALTDTKLEVLAYPLLHGTIRLYLASWLQVVVDGGAVARLRRIRCGDGYGWSVTHDLRQASGGGRVLVNHDGGRTYALSAGAEALLCLRGATPTRLVPAEGSCALPADCAAPTRCDPGSQRCVLPRGAACAANGPPCDEGARCFDAVCVAQTAADADVVPCASDADCPDERCDLARRECRSPVDATGARPCTARRECGIDEECSPASRTCVPSAVRRCAAHRDCPEGYTCGASVCVSPEPLMCIRDPRRAEVQQAQCPSGFMCDGNARCAFRACAAGEALCGPRCERLDAPLHCGACFAASPPRPNAVPRCVLGAPVFQCLPGYGDCDGDAANGCEARIDREGACGACGVRCAANETCVGMRCSATPRSAVTDVSVGPQYACALHVDGGVSCWGVGYGEPRRVAVRNAVKVAAGREFACAVTRSDQLTCWSPTRALLTLEGVADVSVGREHACAAMRDGAVRCWGVSFEGGLGDGGSVQASSPVAVRMPAGVRAVQVAVGGAHSCLRGADGSVWCWGRNDEGQLGDGTYTSRNVPARVNLEGVSDLRAGLATTLALRDGQVLGWGMGTGGQLGPRRGLEPTPVVVALPNRARGIAVAGMHACATLVDGRVLCQGSSDVANAAQPTAIAGLDAGVTSLSLGTENGCAVLRTGFVACWGSNGWGILTPSGALGRSAAARPLYAP